VIFGRQLTGRQWVGILITCLGLAVGTLGTSLLDELGTAQLVGIVVTLSATLVYSAIYNISDYVLQSPIPISTQKLGSVNGVVAFSVSIVYLFIFTFPNWQVLFVDSVEAAHGNYYFIIIAYISLALANLLHNWSYYGLIGNVGSVGTGILQSLRAVMVFFGSSILFCSEYETQCLTVHKIVAAVLVIAGLLVYIYSKKEQSSVIIRASGEVQIE